MLSLGIDIGGTNVRCAVVRVEKSQAKVLEKWQFETPKTRAGVLDVLFSSVEKAKRFSDARKLRGIGLGVPGPLSADRSRVLLAPNVPQLNGLRLPLLLRKKFRIPVRMENDADAFALGQALVGSARSSRRVLGITLGTGVGGGLVMDGRIDRGTHGSAGEIGHMVVVANGRRCSCGGRGHLEEYVSKRAFLRQTRVDAWVLERRARKGNRSALAVFQRIGASLGAGIASAVNLWDPDIIVVGGGVSESGKYLLEPAVKRMRQEILSPLARRSVKVRRARFGPFAGAIGAALLFS